MRKCLKDIVSSFFVTLHFFLSPLLFLYLTDLLLAFHLVYARP